MRKMVTENDSKKNNNNEFQTLDNSTPNVVKLYYTMSVSMSEII